MPVFVFLEDFGSGSGSLEKYSRPISDAFLSSGDHLLYGAQSVPALELLKRGDENFELGYLFAPA